MAASSTSRLVSRPFVFKITPEFSLDPQYLTIADAIVTIGRAHDNHIVLAHASVGLVHARLFRSAAGIDIEADGSNTVLVDGTRIRRKTSVNDGHVISVGQYTLELLDRDPPNERERAFLKAIECDPRDDSTRVVYGDWLEEVGRTDEAEFLRAQLEMKTRTSADDPRFQQLSNRTRELGERLSIVWRRTIASPALEKCGGMQYQVRCPKEWDQLTPTRSPKERYCESCKRNVHYATTIDEARTLTRAGECIVIDIVQRRSPGDLANPPPRPPDYFAGPVPNPGVFLPPPGWNEPPPKK